MSLFIFGHEIYALNIKKNKKREIYKDFEVRQYEEESAKTESQATLWTKCVFVLELKFHLELNVSVYYGLS